MLLAKQGDVGRKFKAIVTDGGAACAALAGAAVSVWYSGASGDGNYTDIGADSAVSISGNEITVELITQMLTNYGAGTLCLVINTADGDQLGTWNIPYMVEPVPGMGSAAAEAYFTAFSQAIQNLPYPDASLSAAGKAADAAAVGERFANMKAADIGAAPVGLVTKALSVADEAALDAALSAELAAMAENTAQFLVISPKSGALFGGVGMLCELYKRSASGYGTAKFTGYGSESPDVLYKTLWAGVWQPLEWENPPMLTGVEYRTTERWNGKAVYTQMRAGLALPNADVRDIPFYIPNNSGVIRYRHIAYGPDMSELPMASGSSITAYGYFAQSDDGLIYRYKTSTDLTNYTESYIQLWYTKS
ncbi:MAG: hypothetical protein IJX37_02165 [Oscillospiraceae bacterium]|nr:hypothetical protein [Oscillospiraceae bacterium]